MRPFYQATAEQVVLVCEAVVSLNGSNAGNVEAFTDLPKDKALSALQLAVDLKLLSEEEGHFAVASTLCQYFRTPQDAEKAALVRVTIESYEPFRIFREELEATGNVTTAAQRTKVRLNLDCHREQVKETLLSLATFSGALKVAQGNVYERDARGLTALLDELAAGSREIAEATLTIRDELGEAANLIDQEGVISHLAAALRHAAASNGREAVLQAGIAVENFLTSVASRQQVDIAHANGINAKVERLARAGFCPQKLQNVSKYLGHIRNAADHGVDDQIGAPWIISAHTGRNYVFVASTFIAAMIAHREARYEL